MAIDEYHVLLIDDDEDDYVNLRDLFREIPRNKYKITWVSSYNAGIEALNSRSFDVCLLDYRLGERTGIDLLKEINGSIQTSPIIFLTGYGDFDLDVQAMQMGAAEYLVKDQLSAPLLERTIRYTMKHAMDMQELRESKAQIIQQDRLASLGLLASSLAHEIGTPMGIIRSRAELVEKKAGENETIRQDMKTIVTQIDRITKLVNSLLHLAREKKSDVAVPVNLNTAIQDVLNLIRHEFDRKSISLQIQIEDDLQVKAESGPLGQVVLNLLVNSLHAIEEAKEKGLQGPHQVTISTRPFNHSVEILIHDTGCGISKENLSQLFKPFFTTKEIGMGTGLGLATSFKLVQSWGGHMEAESQVHQGTTFKVILRRRSD